MNCRSFQPGAGGVIVRSATGLQAYSPRIDVAELRAVSKRRILRDNAERLFGF